MAAPSWQDLYDLGRYVLQARRPTMLVNPGDVSDAEIGAMATLVDVSIGESAGRFRSTYLDGAVGSDLTDEAADRGTDRILGIKAIGTVTLARPTTGVGAGTIPAGTTIASSPDETGAFATYTTDTAAVYGALDLTKDVAATCTLDGSEGNVGPGQVTRILSSIFDPSITVNNAALFVGGAPEESDPDLRDRAKGLFLTEARGTEAAVIFGAKTVPQVKRASAILDQPTGVVTLYVSDSDGNANAAMIAAVAAVMPQWAPIDSIVNVVGATLLIQPVDIGLTVRAGIDIAGLIDRVRDAIVSRLNLLNPGDTLYRDMISAAARAVDQQNILQVAVNVPAANVVPAATEVIRTDISSISTS
jgi:hypothetical protein